MVRIVTTHLTSQEKTQAGDMYGWGISNPEMGDRVDWTQRTQAPPEILLRRRLKKRLKRRQRNGG